jgi:hypothetical protein
MFYGKPNKSLPVFRSNTAEGGQPTPINSIASRQRITPLVLRFRLRQGFDGQVGFLFCHVAGSAWLSPKR